MRLTCDIKVPITKPFILIYFASLAKLNIIAKVRIIKIPSPKSSEHLGVRLLTQGLNRDSNF